MSSIDLLAAHCMETLPQDFRRRTELLGAVGDVIGDRHPLHAKVELLLEFTRQQDSLQMFLCEEFKNLSRPKEAS